MPPSVTTLNIEPEHLNATLSVRGNSLSGTLSPGQTLEGQIAKNVRQIVYVKDYNLLDNKPQINSVILTGNVSTRDLGLTNIYYDTTENWNQKARLVTEESSIYIYSDYRTIIKDNVEYKVAGIKIGDGTSYLVDMPFVTEELSAALFEHMRDTSIHVTPEEKNFWNNKVSALTDKEDSENLILTKLALELFE